MKKIIINLCVCLSIIFGRTFAQNSHTVEFTIFSINDFHGAFVQNIEQDVPGAPSILHCIDSLKTKYPYHITVAAGDNFGGSYFYNATKGVMLPIFFNDLGISVSALGNHEFDDGQASLARKWKNLPSCPKNWDLTYVCANVFKNGKLLPFIQPYIIKKCNFVGGKKLNIAFVGLLASSAKEQIRAKNIVGVEFSGKYKQILDSLKATPQFDEVKTANIRTLLLHIGTIMDGANPKWHDKNSKNLTTINDPIYQAVLSGHSHEPVCGYINSIHYPVTQGWWHGKYINVMHCSIDTATLQVVKVTPEIVKVPLISKNALKGKALRLSNSIDSLLHHTKTAEGVSIGTYLTRAKNALLHDRMDKYRESEMGKLVCCSYAEAFRKQTHLKDTDIIIGVSHFGSIRAGFPKGKISVLDVGEALPFSNALKVYKMTGKELFSLLDFGYHNKAYGWIQCGNVIVKRNRKNDIVKIYYVSPKGVTHKIRSNDVCYVVADEFMTNGGDGYSPSLFPKEKLVSVQLPSTTSAFIKYLSEQESI